MCLIMVYNRTNGKGKGKGHCIICLTRDRGLINVQPDLGLPQGCNKIRRHFPYNNNEKEDRSTKMELKGKV
jgi:hypothetical protein